MKKHIPNFITSCNVLTGAVGVVWILVEGNPTLTILFVLVAAFFDLMDGLVARSLGVQSEIGKQLDSLADVVSFGLLPAIGLYVFLSSQGLNLSDFEPIRIPDLLPLLIVPFSALRLAIFNISTDQSDEFRGLPTPANALMLSGLLLIDQSMLSFPIVVVVVLMSCFLLVSRMRMLAFKFKNWGWKGNELRYALLLVILIGVLFFQVSFIPFVIPVYILFSFIGNYLFKTVVSTGEK